MIVGFLLHLYQPPTQEESVFRQIFNECYQPLLKNIKFYKDIPFTLNVPLSFLEQIDRYGYKSWLQDLKELVSSERVEVTGSAAYHPLLTKLPEKHQESQIFLNEYGLAYYLGKHKGFEGENALMIKNLYGFFPPELAINEQLLNFIDSLGYSWTVCENYSIIFNETLSNKTAIYALNNNSIHIVTRDTPLSNLISFKRDTDVLDIKQYMELHYDNETLSMISLDAEVFGHHNRDGVALFDNIMSLLMKRGDKVLLGSQLAKSDNPKILETISESTWGMNDFDYELGNIYPLWDIKGNKVHKILWELISKFNKEMNTNPRVATLDGFETLPLWQYDQLNKLDDNVRQEVFNFILHLKSQNSDQFWWSSNVTIVDKVLYNPTMIFKTIDYYKEILKYNRIIKLEDYLLHKEVELKELLV